MPGPRRPARPHLEWSNAPISVQQCHRELYCHRCRIAAENPSRAIELADLVAVVELGDIPNFGCLLGAGQEVPQRPNQVGASREARHFFLFQKLVRFEEG